MPLQYDGPYKKQGKKRSSLKKGESLLPPPFQSRLNDLFHQIEKEFEALYLDNLALREKLDQSLYESRDTSLLSGGGGGAGSALSTNPADKSFQPFGSVDTPDGPCGGDILTSMSGKSSKIKGSGIPGQQKVALRLKAQTNRIVSSFKTNNVTCSLQKEFGGHKDGIWDVTAAKLAMGIPVIGTASADHKAGVWSAESGRCLLRYQGHNGSVNSIRFHPTRELALTASGDNTAHIWQASVAWEQMVQKGLSSEEEFESSEKEELEEGDE